MSTREPGVRSGFRRLAALAGGLRGRARAETPAAAAANETRAAHDPADALVHEVESLRQMQQALVSAKQAAEAAMLAKGEFLATMSHEIRTPLNGILPLLELVLSTKLTVDQRDYISTAHKSARELLRIVDDILDYSKLEANKVELETVGFNLREVVDAVARLLERNAESKGLRLGVSIDGGVRLAVRGDPVRLRQVLTNLVSNAIKFTDRGGVAIRIGKRAETRSHYEIVFGVRDTGIGIAPEAAARLFQPFSQADASTTRVFGGTGLGLVICKRLVDLMGGQIGVKSEPGRGSLFWFSVPLLKAIGDAHVRRDLSGARALLLGTDVNLRRRLEGLLTPLGVACEQSGVPVEALTRLRASAGMGERWAHEILIVDAASFRTAIGTLARGVLRDAALERVRLLLLVPGGVLPAELADETRVRGIAPGFGEGELRNALNALLEVVDAAAERRNLLVQAEESMPAAAESAAVSPHTPLRGQVLLVEDNAVNRQVAQRLLSLHGLEVDVAGDGREALARIAQRRYDLVLMDCQMPQMDGYTATRQLRAVEAAQGGTHLPVIAMTANAMAGDREKCLAAGMDDYLSKPLDRAALERTLRHWLQKADTRRRPAATTAAPTPAPAAAVPATPASVLDGQVVQDLLDVMGVEFTRLVRVYLEDTPRHIATLEQAAARNDVAALVAPAHSLKSTSANLGALALSALAKRIEHGARAGDLADPAGLVRQIRNEFERAADALRALIENG